MIPDCKKLEKKQSTSHHDVPIRGEMIRLGQLLKLAGVVQSGSEVKAFLASEPLWVNGERESRRGRQLHPGDIVRVDAQDLGVDAHDLGLDAQDLRVDTRDLRVTRADGQRQTRPDG